MTAPTLCDHHADVLRMATRLDHLDDRTAQHTVDSAATQCRECRHGKPPSRAGQEVRR